MGREQIKANASLEAAELRTQRLTTTIKLTAATAATAVAIRSDAPGVIYFKTEGNDNVSGQDSGAVTATQSDVSGKFGVLVKLQPQLEAEEVVMIQTEDVTGLATGGVTVTRIGTDGISASGNIELAVECAGQDFNSQDLTLALDIVYKVKEI